MHHPRHCHQPGSTALGALLLVLIPLLACREYGKPTGGTVGDAAPDGAAPGASAHPPGSWQRSTFEVRSGDGTWERKLEPDGVEYRILDQTGVPIGKARIETDRVKIKDASGAEQAKAKAKDYGFKVYDSGETEVLKAKRSGAGYKFQSGTGSELGSWGTDRGTLGGDEVRVEVHGDRAVVKRGTEPAASVSASVPVRAAVMLALTESTFEQRLAALLFELEVKPP
jgi:hypothetical protein